MMSIAHLLDDFAASGQSEQGLIQEVELEEERLASFEKGYQAGWDDAVKSQVADGRRITADLAQNLHKRQLSQLVLSHAFQLLLYLPKSEQKHRH